MDPKALSKLCNSGGELPRLSNSCQQYSAAGTEREVGCRTSRELRAVFRFVECRSPKRNLAQNRVSSTLGRNAVKPFLLPKSQPIALFFFFFFTKDTCEWNQYQSFAWEISYIFQITFLILVMDSFLVDQGMVVLSETSFLFHILRDQ